MSKLSRRGFFIEVAKFSGLALIAPAVLRLGPAIAMAEERRRGGGDANAANGPLALPLAVSGQGAAAGVNYVDDKKKMTKKDLKTDRQGVKWEAQSCSGCTFFKAAGKKDGKDVGSCTVLAANLVEAKGWCSSWTKKA